MSKAPGLGPLTTPVSLPNCVTSLQADSTSNFWWGFSDLFLVRPLCFPVSYTNDRVYSPGVCPIGWTSACTFAVTDQLLNYDVPSTATAVQCCPESYTCFAIAWCRSELTAIDQTSSLTLSTDPATPVTIPFGSSLPCRGKPILVAYGATDTAIARYFLGDTAVFQSSTSSATQSTDSTLSSVSSTSIPTSSASQSSSNTTSSTTGSSDLSSGAKIGIGVAIPLVAIIIALSAWLAIIYRKKRRIETSKLLSGPETAEQASRKPELHANSSRLFPQTGQLTATIANNNSESFKDPQQGHSSAHDPLYAMSSRISGPAELSDISAWDRTPELEGHRNHQRQ